MNKQQYRIVFNKARGQYMAVAEVAHAQGKDSGNTPGTVVRKALLSVISLNLALNPLFSQMAHAQIVADPSAPGNQRPTVLAAPNGVPVVNIQTPSAAGVSRNTYTQFDVNQAGAILNNSRSNVQSRQGGWVQGNPWLARGEARIILNEVNSANPSQIKGYVEIAGQRAELVIANPAGINVDGGGFINASRAILTTGTPQMGTGGSLEGYRVDRGTITINGKGLDASLVDYTGILARAAQVNAGIWTKELGVVLGSNTVSATAGQSGGSDVQSSHAPMAPAPQFALDVSQLGGMYAGKISLVGTEAGVGVRNAGAIGASAGQVQLSADGMLTNSGTISASAAGQNVSLDTKGRGLDNSGTIASQGDVQMVNNGATRNSGAVNAARQLQLRATELDNSQGTLTAAQLDIAANSLRNTNGAISQTGLQDLRIEAQTLSNTNANGKTGTMGAMPLTASGGGAGSGNTAPADTSTISPSTSSGGSTSTSVVTVPEMLAMGIIAAGQIDNAGGSIVANGATDLATSQGLSNSGSIQLRNLTSAGTLDNSAGNLSAQNVTLNLGHFNNVAGSFYSQNSLQVLAQNLNNAQGSITTGGSFTANVQHAIGNQGGTLAAQGDISLNSQTLDNSAAAGKTGTISSNPGSIAINATDDVTNRGGVIQSVSTAPDKTLSITTSVLDNTAGALTQGGSGGMSVTASRSLDNSRGQISSNGALALNAGALVNTGGIISAQHDITAQTTSIDNSQGKLLAQNALTLNSTGDVINSAGQIGANEAVQFSSSSLRNDQQGHITSGNGTLAISTGALNNQTGSISARQDTHISSLQLDNARGQISAGTIAIDTHQQSLVNHQGKIVSSAGAIDLSSGALNNQAGLIQSRQQLRVNTHGQALNNANTNGVGGLLAGNDLVLNTGAWNNLRGNVQAAGAMQAHSASLDNSNGKVLAGDALTLEGAGAVVNTAGQIAASKTVQLRAGSISNTAQGQIGSVADAVNLNAGEFDNQAGNVTAKTSLVVDSQALNNTQGTLAAATVSIDTHQHALNNNGGTLAATAGSLDLRTGAFNNQSGAVFSTETLELVATGGLDNTQGKIASHSNAFLDIGGFVANRAGTIQAGKDTPSTLALRSAGGVDNSAGGTIGSLGSLAFSSAGLLQNMGGNIVSNNDVSLLSSGVDNAGGNISGNAVSIESRDNAGNWQAIHNQGGSIAANQALTIDSGKLDNSTAGSITTVLPGSTLTARSHGRDIVNLQSGSKGGFLAGGSLQIDTRGGRLDNGSGGYMGAIGAMDLSAASILNQSGTIAAEGNIGLRSTSAGGIGLDNSAGTIQAKASDITIAAGSADINNQAGHIVADRDLSITTTGRISNQRGEMTAGQAMTVTDSAGITNTDGTLHAGQRLALRNTSVSGDGKLLSDRDLELALRDSYTLESGGQLSANGQLTLSSQGNITNQGQILGGTGVTVSATNIDNQAGASITSAGTTSVKASGTLNNRGLIDGADTQVSAGTVNNAGSGRIYGDRTVIRAGTLNNTAEAAGGVQTSATIAGRERLDIATQTLNNSGGSTLLSLGDLNVAAAIDDEGIASIGQAVAINNHGSHIESMGNMRLNALDVNNTNANLSITPQVLQSSTSRSDMFAPPGEEPQDAMWFREVGGSVGLYKIANPDLWGIRHAPAYAPQETSCSGGDSEICTTTPAYYEPRTSTRYAQFGVTPPPAAVVAQPTPEQYGGFTYTSGGYDGASETVHTLWPRGSDKAGYEAALAAYNADQQAEKDAAVALNNVIKSVNAENNRTINQYRNYVYIGGVSESVYKDEVATSDPGRISVGGNLSVQGNLNNIDSSVIAGGDITVTGGALNNQATQGTESTATRGTAYSIEWKYHGGFRDSQERRILGVYPYSNLSSITFNLPTTVYRKYTAPQYQGRVDANGNDGQNVQTGPDTASGPGRSTAGVVAQGAAGAVQQHNGVSADLHTVAGTGATSTAVGTGAATEIQLAKASANGSTIARTVAPGAALPNSSLYVIHAGNGNAPLVETDPRFTNYRQWLSSDYMLQALAIDPALSQKRLGDGFHEQRLIREQVAQLTGRRFIGDYRSDDEQYKALMDAGVTFGKAFGIRPGIALTQEQIAQLTSDIVWLVEREVGLADGSRQKVLVPQVYVVTRAGDVMPDGALISGDSVKLQLSGDVRNSGTIAGRKVVGISADNIHNVSGRISGDAVNLKALNDINVIGATVQARSTLIADAGRDLNVKTTTSTNTAGDKNNGFSTTVIDRVAGLYLDGTASDAGQSNNGLMLLTAGNNLNLTGALIGNPHANGNTIVQAGNDVNPGTVTTNNQHNIRFDSRNHLNWGSSTELGSMVYSDGDLQVSAGNDVNARAVQMAAGRDLAVAAGRNINIEAGTATRNLDDAYYRSGSSLFGSSSLTLKNTVQTTEAITSNIAGQTVRMHAGENLTAHAANISATDGGMLSAGNNMTLGAAENTQKERHFEHSTSSGLSLSGWSSSQSTRSDTLDATTHTGSVASTISGNIVLAGNLNGAAATQANKGVVTLAGSTVRSQEGMAMVTGNHVLLDAVRDSEQTSSSLQSRSTSYSPWQFAAGKKATSDSRTETTTLQGSSVQGGHGAAIIATGAALGQAADLQAGAGKLLVQGAAVSLQGGLNSNASHSESTFRKSGIDTISDLIPGKGINYKSQGEQDRASTTLVPTTLGGSSVEIRSTAGDLSLAGVEVKESTTPVTLASAGQLNLDVVQTTDQSSSSGKASDLAWQSVRGSGHVDQTTHYNQLGSNVSLIAPQITAQMSVKDSAGVLARQPGLQWLGQLASNPELSGKVNWQQVQEAHDKWDYKQQGLTPAAAAVVAVVVAYFTAGAGTSLATSAGMTTTAGSAGASGIAAAGAGVAGSGVAAGTVLTTTGAVVAGASGAAISTLASKAAVSFINNGGNLNKTLQDLGSSDSVKQLAAAALTGGALAGLNAAMGWDKPPPQGTTLDWADRLGRGLSNNLADASIKSALGQGKLEDNLKGAIAGAVGASLANAVGDLSSGDTAALNSFGNKVAHALVGCGMGAAIEGGSKGCAAGALGAVVAEATAELYNAGGTVKPFTKEIGQITAIVAAAVAGQDVNVAQLAGGNAITNNFLKHTEAQILQNLKDKALAGKCDSNCQTELKALADLDNKRNADLEACSGVNSAECNSLRQEVRNAAAEYIRADRKNPLQWYYQSEKQEAQSLANGTMNGVVWGSAKGAGGALADGVQAIVKATITGLSALFGDTASRQDIKAGSPEFDTFLPFLPVFRVCDLYESITCKHFSGNSCSLNIYS